MHLCWWCGQLHLLLLPAACCCAKYKFASFFFPILCHGGDEGKIFFENRTKLARKTTASAAMAELMARMNPCGYRVTGAIIIFGTTTSSIRLLLDKKFFFLNRCPPVVSVHAQVNTVIEFSKGKIFYYENRTRLADKTTASYCGHLLTYKADIVRCNKVVD